VVFLGFWVDKSNALLMKEARKVGVLGVWVDKSNALLMKEAKNQPYF
jgi:hypothetical protein